MKAKQRFPWIPVSAAAAALVVGVAAWMQIPAAPSASSPDGAMPAFGFARLDPSPAAEVQAEQLAAYDPTPLFLPTTMNSGQNASPDEGGRHVGGPFAVLKPRWVFGEKKADLAFPLSVVVPAGPAQGLALTERREAPLVMGRTDGVGAKLPARQACVQAVREGDSRVVLTLALPETAGGPQGDWQPMELMGAVSRFGLVGGLIVTVSSGSDGVDDYFSAQLARVVRVGERLPPGFYTFRVGP